MKRLSIILAFLALSACTSGPQSGRSIEVSHSVPVSSTVFSKDVGSLVKKRAHSYVSLAITQPERRQSDSIERERTKVVTTGSGFVIDNKGHVITAAHVGQKRGWKVVATGPNGQLYQGRVIALRHIGDMALIKLDNPDTLTPVTPTPTPCLPLGSSILSIGKPGLNRDIARVGTVSKLHFGQKVRYQKYGYNDAMVLRLQTRRGESGGPVFNENGDLVGMIVSTLSSAAGRYLDLAHAVHTPSIGKFICSKTKCSKAWRAIAAKRVKSCPAPSKKIAQLN